MLLRMVVSCAWLLHCPLWSACRSLLVSPTFPLGMCKENAIVCVVSSVSSVFPANSLFTLHSSHLVTSDCLEASFDTLSQQNLTFMDTFTELILFFHRRHAFFSLSLFQWCGQPEAPQNYVEICWKWLGSYGLKRQLVENLQRMRYAVWPCRVLGACCKWSELLKCILTSLAKTARRLTAEKKWGLAKSLHTEFSSLASLVTFKRLGAS